MIRRVTRNLMALSTIALVGCAGRTLAGDNCFYKSTLFSDGSAACQSGRLYKCDDGEWQNSGRACSDELVATSRTCQYGGISYSTGSASCQSGTQYRCEDGAWRTLGLTCAVGDSPIRVVPSGRTCMFGDATVANNSTICKTGTTFLCSDGEWVNLGTQCR